MGDLVRDGEAMGKVLQELEWGIEELERARHQIKQIRPRAFGGSDAGGQTQGRVERAYDAIQHTLAMLNSSHDEFRANLEMVDRLLGEIDQQVADDANRSLAAMDDLGGGSPAVPG